MRALLESGTGTKDFSLSISLMALFLAIWLWLLVISHWILDVISHRPDPPLWPGSRTLLGLGLWNSLVATLVVELTIFVVGVELYAHFTRPRDRTGAVALWSFVALVTVIYLAGAFGPPPPNIKAVAYAGLSTYFFIAWGYWIDRHRRVVPPVSSEKTV